MKAISIKQPYASLMLPPFNKWETRNWHTSYRGQILICASGRSYDEESLKQLSGNHVERMGDIKSYNQWCGYAIAVGKLIHCKPMTHWDEQKTFTLYDRYADIWCHIYEDVRPIVPMRWRGQLGLKDVPQEFIDKIKYLK